MVGVWGGSAPYSCLAFDITAAGTAATDIEHIVALAEAHDSRIADDRRRDIASDLANLTIADPAVNRSEKSDRDAGEWMPARHGAWFAARIIQVKLDYGLSVDPAERAALERLLAGGGAELNCAAADTTSPTVAISSDADAPVTGPFSITIAFSESVAGFELADLVVGNGSASELQGNNASYAATITPATSGTVTVDIAAGAAQDSAGNPSSPADQFSIVADLTPVPVNQPPAPAGTLPNRTLAPDDTLNVDVSQAFVDPDDDALTYTVSSSAPQMVTASVTGALVMLAAGSEGAATIRVTATDPGGLSAAQSFAVTVSSPANRPPEPVGALPPLTMQVDEAAVAVDVASAFRDPDGDLLTYRATSSTLAVAAVAVLGSTVTVAPAAEGTATVTVTATDAGGSNGSATQRFTVRVSPPANRPPEPVGVLAPLTLRVDDPAVTVEVGSAFRDPDGDLLTYRATSSALHVVTVRVAGARVTLTAVGVGRAAIEVTTTDPDGLSAAQSFRVRVTAPFTDDPIRPGVTPVRAIHFTELRARIDVLRGEAALAPFPWTDPVLRAGVTPVRLAHLLELRAALAAAYAAAGRAAPGWTDAAPAAGSTPIRAAHLLELRAAVVALE